MRGLMPLLAGAVLLSAGVATAAPRLDPEARLAKAVEGRVAGEPVRCIQLRNVRSSQIIDDTAIVYDAGGIVYVNRPRSGRESLDRWDTMVTRLYSSQLCNIDVVQLYDSGSQFYGGFVLLGDFVPYRRPRAAR